MTTLPASNPFVALQRLAGAAAEDMAFLDERTRMQYTALGTVFALNFVFLCAAWMKVGYVYLGPVGLLVPGLALPALMVLGLDRVAAMRPRPLEGDLAALGMIPK